MLAGAGLTVVQAGVLSVLAESGPTSQRDIARRLGVTDLHVSKTDHIFIDKLNLKDS
jgi:DNA-binding MarR family transcriptional regulator